MRGVEGKVQKIWAIVPPFDHPDSFVNDQVSHVAGFFDELVHSVPCKIAILVPLGADRIDLPMQATIGVIKTELKRTDLGPESQVPFT